MEVVRTILYGIEGLSEDIFKGKSSLILMTCSEEPRGCCLVICQLKTTEETEFTTEELIEETTRESTEETTREERTQPVIGIDEPIVFYDIRGKDIDIRNPYTVDLELQILDVYTEEFIGSGDSVRYPDDPSNIFLTLLLKLKGILYSPDQWVFKNAILVYDNEEYKAFVAVLKSGELGISFIYEVLLNSEFDQYKLKLPDRQTIDLDSFFD